MTALDTYLYNEIGYPPPARGIWLQALVSRGGEAVEEISAHILIAAWRSDGKQGVPDPGPRTRRAIADHVKGPPVESPQLIEALADSPAAVDDPVFKEAEAFVEAELRLLARTDSYEWLRARAAEPERARDLSGVADYLERHGLTAWQTEWARQGCGPLPDGFMARSEDAQGRWIDARS